MKDQRYHQDFLPREIVLKLHRDIPKSNVEQRIELIKNHAKQVEADFEKEVYEVKLNTELGFCYWEAHQYSQSILYLEKVIAILKPELDDTIYFLSIGLLIRGNRILQNYQSALRWAESAFKNIHLTDSSFLKLNILEDYAALISDSQGTFKEGYKIIITEVIHTLGFPEKGDNPLEVIHAMKAMNLTWNRKLREITLDSNKDLDADILAFERFRQNCPIRWYREYAENIIANIKNSRKI